jgi:hypothetical protein
MPKKAVWGDLQGQGRVMVIKVIIECCMVEIRPSTG